MLRQRGGGVVLRDPQERARVPHGDDVLLGESLTDYLFCDAHINPAHAGPLFTEAIACIQRSGDHQTAESLHTIAGIYALRAGDTTAARAHLHQAAQAMRAVDHPCPPADNSARIRCSLPPGIVSHPTPGTHPAEQPLQLPGRGETPVGHGPSRPDAVQELRQPRG